MQLTDAAQHCLPELLGFLEEREYDFVTPTPATHRRVLGRAGKSAAQGLRDIFGWSLPFEPSLLPRPLLEGLEASGALARHAGGMLLSRVRVARLAGMLFLHSAFPTDEEDAVFLGPDSYRFADLLARELAAVEGEPRLVDFGAGGGVGGIAAARQRDLPRVTLLDTNPLALALARVNAAHAGVAVEIVRGSSLADVDGEVDIVVANPPFMMESQNRIYRSGGDLHGAQLSLDWALQAARRLMSGGRMILYTGAAIVDGGDALRTALEARLAGLGCSLRYREIDPDIFGEELCRPEYAQVERIAAIAAVIHKPA